MNKSIHILIIVIIMKRFLSRDKIHTIMRVRTIEIEKDIYVLFSVVIVVTFESFEFKIGKL
jgi:hypothetical protein